MKYAELDEHIGDITEYLGWLKANRGRLVTLDHVPSLSSSVSMSQYARDERGLRDYSKIDEFETRSKMREVVKTIGSCEKEYVGSSFYVTKKFGDTVKIMFTSSRNAICRKVVKEVKRVPKREYVEVPGQFVDEEVVEWECTDSLLK
jgi:hypothetical protein